MADSVIATEKAPAAIGSYVQARTHNGLLFTSGQLPLVAETGEFVPGDIKARTRQCLTNVAAIAEAAGTSLDRALKVTVFLTDMNDFAAVNEVYAEVFAEPFPARSAIAVAALPKGADVEIEAVIAL